MTLKCPLECQSVIKFHLLNEHLQVCDLMKVECLHCSELIISKDRISHKCIAGLTNYILKLEEELGNKILITEQLVKNRE